uniref:Uncharacterized protein n=1 Tax=Solanum tuberosum TaxID=4113 RepID=M1DQC3_SOLTU
MKLKKTCCVFLRKLPPLSSLFALSFGPRTLPWPVIKTTGRGGLCGLRPELGCSLPSIHEPSHGSCGGPRLVKGPVVHHFWVGVNHGQVDGPWFLLRNNKIEVNLEDDNGNTTLDILAQSWRDVNDLQIGEGLREAGGLRDKDMISSSNIQNVSKFPNSQVALAQKHDMSDD